MDSSLDNDINVVISKYFKDSPLNHKIASEYNSLCRTIIRHIPEMSFDERALLKYVKRSEEDPTPEGEPATRKRKRPPNAYFLFMTTFKELVNRLAIDESLDGKKRQRLGATFWNCLKKEYQAPYMLVAKEARKDFPQMTYVRRRSQRNK
ncbi:7488_t:CDS:1 [Paraglomus brasilianum]|uniref:7488_t:CDS:1 n=1 Tax=Paraglomus brasilianum TaxID=144538 RepID=A0A9N8W0C4_9GLOM|nr:7488_t:CDS:1 [Paraglomus brasilianum]